MDPLSWAMLIMSMMGTANAMTTKNTSDTESAGQATGGPDLSGQPPAIGGMGMEQLFAQAGAQQQPTLAGPVAAAQAAGAGAAQAAPQPNTPAPVPDPKADGTKPQPGVGEILAAVPGALAAAGSLLGINDVNTVTQRAAPIAGGSGGQVVGQFGAPSQNIDIGRLLASLPGIR